MVAADDHLYNGFAKTWDLVGTRPLHQGTVGRSALQRHGIRFVHTRITSIDPAQRRVETEAGRLSADSLVVALGAKTPPDQAAQLRGSAARPLQRRGVAGEAERVRSPGVREQPRHRADCGAPGCEPERLDGLVGVGEHTGAMRLQVGGTPDVIGVRG